jgi:hypothetical protein
MYGLCGKRPSEMQFEALNNDLIAVGMWLLSCNGCGRSWNRWMACLGGSVPCFAIAVVLHHGRASYICILLVIPFLIKLTCVVLRNRLRTLPVLCEMPSVRSFTSLVWQSRSLGTLNELRLSPRISYSRESRPFQGI